MPAKGTVRFVLTPTMLEKAEAAAARGLDHDDIARALGISIATLYAHKSKNEEFAEAIRRGKAKGHLAIADAVYNKAKAGNMDAARLILSRRYGWQEHQKIEVKEMQQGPRDVRDMSEAELQAMIISSLSEKELEMIALGRGVNLKDAYGSDA